MKDDVRAIKAPSLNQSIFSTSRTMTLELSSAQKLFLRGFKSSMKKRVFLHLNKILSETGATSVEQKHIIAALSRAHVDYEKDDSVNPSDTLSASMDAYRDGDWINSEEWLSELRGAIPAAG